MPGDYSRVPRERGLSYSGVLLQQGRVQLDADWNDLARTIDRRLRLLALDCFGRFGISRHSPDAFRVTAAPKELLIGAGRAYVDGLLVENRGAGRRADDPVTGERLGTSPVSYLDQPFMGLAPKLPTKGRYLAYLDVWQREITAVENPDLIDPALGTDTSSRVQTVWQVKLADLPTDIADDDLDDQPWWLGMTRPAPSRLTVTGGYVGLENRLYRVEIHSAGHRGGGGTFKWSRDNGSVALCVTAPPVSDGSRTVVPVHSSNEPRFANAGDVVELVDDALYFSRGAGLLAAVIDDNSLTDGKVTLDADIGDAVDPARSAVLRRWDHGPAADAEGAVEFANKVPIRLEDGLVVTFILGPEGSHRAGDYWTFAARATDGSVESLTNSPPHGIEHHYAPLAIVHFPGSIRDLRPNAATKRHRADPSSSSCS